MSARERRVAPMPTPHPERDPIRLDFRKLRARRRYLDLTQQYVADQAGIHRNALSYWERGHRIPDSLELAKVARVLGTPYWDLFDVVDINGATVEDPWRGRRGR